MLAATTTVRVSQQTRALLAAMSSERGVSTADLIAELVALEHERDLLRSMNEGFAQLANDPEAMAAYREEQRSWDATVGDGLS